MLTPSQDRFEEKRFSVGPGEAGSRLDAVLAKKYSEYSRSLLTSLIREGRVEIQGDKGEKLKPSRKLEVGEAFTVMLPVMEEARLLPDMDIPLTVLHEDDDIVVLNKQPKLACHPQRAHQKGTLTNALVARYGHELPADDGDELRLGIVHRLDGDTTGAIVCARTPRAFDGLKRQFHDRSVEKVYVALVHGAPKNDSFTVDVGLERDPDRPKAMRVNKVGGYPARTDFEVIERFDVASGGKGRFAYIRAKPVTGRTHQIRVHLASRSNPILADVFYSGRKVFRLADISEPDGRQESDRILLDRHALHAQSLTFNHPVTGERMRFEVELPADMARTLEALCSL